MPKIAKIKQIFLAFVRIVFQYCYSDQGKGIGLIRFLAAQKNYGFYSVFISSCRFVSLGKAMSNSAVKLAEEKKNRYNNNESRTKGYKYKMKSFRKIGKK